MDVPERRNPTLPTLRYKAVEPAMRELFVEAAEDAWYRSRISEGPGAFQNTARAPVKILEQMDLDLLGDEATST